MAPILHTDRLTLRPFALADAPDVFAYTSNPNLSRHTTWPVHATVADTVAFIEWILGRPANEAVWALQLRERPTAIGGIELAPTDAAVAEVHFGLDERYWDRGLMTEAARAVLDWGWATLPQLRQVRTRSSVENTRSRRVLDKCGFRFEGISRYTWVKSATPVAQAEYVLDRPTDP